jgi:hypothetical protein
LQAVSQPAPVASPVGGLARHLRVQIIAPAFRVFVLSGQLYHLFLQIHQPAIRFEVPRRCIHPRFFVVAAGHEFQFLKPPIPCQRL